MRDLQTDIHKSQRKRRKNRDSNDRGYSHKLSKRLRQQWTTQEIEDAWLQGIHRMVTRPK